MQDRTDPHARECAFAAARRDPPAGVSPDEAVAEMRDTGFRAATPARNARPKTKPTSAAWPPASWQRPPSPASCRRSASASPSGRPPPFAASRPPLRSPGLGRGAADALAQRVHQIDDVLAAGPLLRRDRLARALAVDQVDQRGLVVVLELVGSKRPLFWFTLLPPASPAAPVVFSPDRARLGSCFHPAASRISPKRSLERHPRSTVGVWRGVVAWDHPRPLQIISDDLRSGSYWLLEGLHCGTN